VRLLRVFLGSGGRGELYSCAFSAREYLLMIDGMK
jgi:hypothetical protein